MNLTKEQAAKGGRTSSRKGVPNRTSEEIRILFKNLLENNMDKLQADIDELEPKERIDALLKMSKFILPTLRAVEMKGEIKNRLQKEVIITLQ